LKNLLDVTNVTDKYGQTGTDHEDSFTLVEIFEVGT